MKRTLVGCLFVLAPICTTRPAVAQTAVSVNARIGDFHVAVANYYHVPEREVVVIRERRISDDDLPVVLFIAREARVPASRVLAMREHGRSWWDISVAFGLRPDVYYVPVAVDPGPPYGRAHGHFKKPRHKWNTIVLSDADIVHLVHVKFLSAHYGIPVERVVEARGRNRNAVAVYSDIETRHGKSGRTERASSLARGKGGESAKGNGGGNGKGRGGKK